MKKEHLMSKKSRVGLGNSITRVLKASNPKYPVRFTTSYAYPSRTLKSKIRKPESITTIHISWGGNDYFLMVSVEEDILIHSVSHRGSIEWDYTEQVVSEVTSIDVVYEALRLIASNFDDFSIETRKSRIKYTCRDCSKSFKTFESAVNHKQKYEEHVLFRKKI